MFEIRVHGLGGQGAVTLVTWLARLAYNSGKRVQAFPFFGAERRGAPVKAFLRIDEKPIDLRSQIYRPDLLVVMSPDLVRLALEEGISPDGRVLIDADSELAQGLANRFGRDFKYLDATGISLGLGLEYDGIPMTNVPMFAAISGEIGLGELDEMLKVLGKVVRRSEKDSYVEALKAGLDGVRIACSSSKVVEEAFVSEGKETGKFRGTAIELEIE